MVEKLMEARKKQMLKIGIFGIGSIGSLISKYMIRNQTNNCFFFNRSKKENIRVKFLGQEEVIQIELSKEFDQNLDWLIVCLKEYHFQKAFPKLKELITENTKVAIFQNGINPSARYVKLAKTNDILETIIDCPIQKTELGTFLQIKEPKIILPNSELANDFVQLFSDSEIEIVKSENFIEAQWIKLIESSSLGSIQAYTGKPCSIFQDAIYLNEFKELVLEGIEVAKSEEISICENLYSHLMAKLKGYPESKGSSILTDKLAGNKLELDAKIGAILKVANRNEVKVPTTQRMYDLLLTQNHE